MTLILSWLFYCFIPIVMAYLVNFDVHADLTELKSDPIICVCLASVMALFAVMGFIGVFIL